MDLVGGEYIRNQLSRIAIQIDKLSSSTVEIADESKICYKQAGYEMKELIELSI